MFQYKVETVKYYDALFVCYQYNKKGQKTHVTIKISNRPDFWSDCFVKDIKMSEVIRIYRVQTNLEKSTIRLIKTIKQKYNEWFNWKIR